MIKAFWYTFLPMVIALGLTPIILFIAKRKKLYTETNERTIHDRNIPQLGGIAIYIAFVITVIVIFKFDKFILGLLAGGTIIFVTGLIDDVWEMRALVKLLMQIVAALVVIFVGGVSIDKINLPFGIIINTPLILGTITFLWIVGVTNAINLIDGLDGLAAGISAIVLITLGIISVGLSSVSVSIVALILLGAVLGFLPYNFYPAKIFLGDCGAQFLGFTLACITIISFKSTAFITLLIPFAILFIPLMDTLLAIIRRTLSGRKITEADRSHLHHVLMIDLKLGHRKTVLLLYVVSILFGAAACLYRYDQSLGSVVLVTLVVLFEIFIEYTGMINAKYHPILSLFKFISKKDDE